jgi:hypothetical protein
VMGMKCLNHAQDVFCAQIRAQMLKYGVKFTDVCFFAQRKTNGTNLIYSQSIKLFLIGRCG